LKLAAMVGLTFLVGGRLIPWLLDRVAATRSRELFTLTVLVVALGIAVGSAMLFDVSMALGAFLAGMVVGRSEFSLRAATEALPMRDAFAVLFFVSVGGLFSPADLMESPALIAATLAIILLGKPLAALTIVLLLKYPLRTAVSVAVALAQVGEFSFILATAGRNLGVLDDLATNAIIAAAVISISLNPILYRLIDTIEPWLQRVLKTAPRKGSSDPSTESRAENAGHRAIVIGYGPVGRTLARLLRANAIEPVVIELNLETARRLGDEGVRAIYGDASHRDTLVEAHVEDAIAVILSSSNMHAGSETIRIARELNPKILTFARSNYLSEVTALRHAGADVVFSGEGEVALSMTELILRQLGATPDQIDKERARVREDLFGGEASTGGLPIGKTWPETAVEASLLQEKAPGSTDVS
jgi:CPA2 family monovalent cation:H+ antiporter-2